MDKPNRGQKRFATTFYDQSFRRFKERRKLFSFLQFSLLNSDEIKDGKGEPIKSFNEFKGNDEKCIKVSV